MRTASHESEPPTNQLQGFMVPRRFTGITQPHSKGFRDGCQEKSIHPFFGGTTTTLPAIEDGIFIAAASWSRCASRAPALIRMRWAFIVSFQSTACSLLAATSFALAIDLLTVAAAVLRAAPFVNPLALSAFSTALTHGLFFFIECSPSVFWTHLPVNSPRHLGSCAVFLPLSWVLITPVFVDALMDLDVLTIGGSTTAPEPGKPIA